MSRTHIPVATAVLRRIALGPIALGAAALLALSACGSSTPASGSPLASSPSSATTKGLGGSGGFQDGFQGSFPGAFGTIAAIQGKTLQVQNQEQGQVAVTYDAATSFTDQVDGSLSDVKVGDCVVVTPSSSSSSGSSSGPVAAGSVRITAATHRKCTSGGTVHFGSGSGFGGRGSFSGGRPSGFPSGFSGGTFPSGAPSGFSGRGSGGIRVRSFGAFGKVTAVSGGGFTVSETFGAPGQSGSRPSKVSVSVDGSTTYTTTKTGDAADLKVGLCVSATGKSDDTGAVAASDIAISKPVDGSCTGGAGGFRTGSFGGGAGAAS